jgi:hypothetical protein
MRLIEQTNYMFWHWHNGLVLLSIHFFPRYTEIEWVKKNKICHPYHRLIRLLLPPRGRNLVENIIIIIIVIVITWVVVFLSFDFPNRENISWGKWVCMIIENWKEKNWSIYVIENIDRLCLPSSNAWTRQVYSQLILLIACVDRCRPVDPRVFSHFTIYRSIVMTKLCDFCLCNSYNCFIAFVCFFFNQTWL